VTPGTGLSGGGTSGNVTLNNTGVLSLTAGSGITSTGGQTPTLSLNTSVTDARYAQLAAASDTFSGSVSAQSFSGNGSGLTSLTAANIRSEERRVGKDGKARTATTHTTTATATTAATATRAANLGGQPASAYQLAGSYATTG